MFQMKQKNTLWHVGKKICLIILSVFGALAISVQSSDSVPQQSIDDSILISKYKKINDQVPFIVLDSSNIKQFWIDKTVLSKRDFFSVLLNKNKSNNYNIQLKNVNANQDCQIDVFSKTKDFSFCIFDSKMIKICNSTLQEDFIGYHVESARICFDDFKDLSFWFKFTSELCDTIDIKQIIMSFPQNESFLSSPGNLIVNLGNTKIDGTVNEGDVNVRDNNSFTISGNRIKIISEKKILVNDNIISYSVSVKNVGDSPATVYVGYAPYTHEGKRIDNRVGLYKDSKQIVKVVSHSKDSNSIIVDANPTWEKRCYIVKNANEDLSDFPNTQFIDSPILEVKQTDNGLTEIVLEKPLNYSLEKGSSLRIQSKSSDTYIYTDRKVLNPNDEAIFTSTLSKDDSFYQYSKKAFCRGTYYVTPILLSYSQDSEKSNTIMVTNFNVSF